MWRIRRGKRVLPCDATGHADRDALLSKALKLLRMSNWTIQPINVLSYNVSSQDVTSRCLWQRAIPLTIVMTIKIKEAQVMLNENIKNLRKAKGISQEELAIRLNVVRQTVSKWERGVSQTKGY